MNTLSLGQATRERPQIAERIRRIVARPRRITLALDSPPILLLAEILLAAASYALAVVLFARDRGVAWAFSVLRSTILFAVVFRVVASASARLYQRSLRYANALDLISIAKAVSLSSLLLGAFVLWRFPQLQISTAVLVVDAAFLMLFWGGLHFGERVMHARRAVQRKRGKRAIVVGAGDAGMTVLKELALDPASPSLPVAVVDDDPRKWGRSLYDVPIIGGTRQLMKIAAEARADEILICIPSASHAQMHDILDAARRSNLPVRSLPSLAEIIHGTNRGAVSLRDLRSPRIGDLLQRDEIRIDGERTREIVGGRTILVTGAGGSIGSELCRQIAAAGPRKLVLVDKSENGLFYANLESSECLGKTRVRPYLTDVAGRDRVTTILENEQPEIVFHAAAHKHVAMLELHPEEAIRNNVIGTRNVAEAALASGAARFVNISTDKAVDPRNYMGLSKKLTELCIQEFARMAGTGRTRFSNVRFGNVAGSTGSVLRLFWEQIQKGGPVRVTDSRATRYFMSVPEAVHLILRAAALGRGGETFVLDMGEPLNIYELAKTMTLFAGLRPEIDIPIEFTGLHDGEKVSEALWEESEHPVSAASDRIFEIREQSHSAQGILERIARMEDLLAANDTVGLLEYLHEMFPAFRRKADLARPAEASEVASAEAL